MYAAGWIMTLFSSLETLPLPHVAALWDVLLAGGGWKVLFRAVLALLECAGHDLLLGDFPTIVQFLHKYPQHRLPPTPAALLRRAMRFKVTHTTVRALETAHAALSAPPPAPAPPSAAAEKAASDSRDRGTGAAPAAAGTHRVQSQVSVVQLQSPAPSAVSGVFSDGGDDVADGEGGSERDARSAGGADEGAANNPFSPTAAAGADAAGDGSLLPAVAGPLSPTTKCRLRATSMAVFLAAEGEDRGAGTGGVPQGVSVAGLPSPPRLRFASDGTGPQAGSDDSSGGFLDGGDGEAAAALAAAAEAASLELGGLSVSPSALGLVSTVPHTFAAGLSSEGHGSASEDGLFPFAFNEAGVPIAAVAPHAARMGRGSVAAGQGGGYGRGPASGDDAEAALGIAASGAGGFTASEEAGHAQGHALSSQARKRAIRSIDAQAAVSGRLTSSSAGAPVAAPMMAARLYSHDPLASGGGSSSLSMALPQHAGGGQGHTLPGRKQGGLGGGGGHEGLELGAAAAEGRAAGSGAKRGSAAAASDHDSVVAGAVAAAAEAAAMEDGESADRRHRKARGLFTLSKLVPGKSARAKEERAGYVSPGYSQHREGDDLRRDLRAVQGGAAPEHDNHVDGAGDEIFGGEGLPVGVSYGTPALTDL
jgi:hypothetical protein